MSILPLTDLSLIPYQLPKTLTSKFSKAILAGDILKAADLIVTQEDRDYVFEQLNITEAKIKELGIKYNYDPEVGDIIVKLGYIWKYIYNSNVDIDPERLKQEPALTVVANLVSKSLPGNRVMVDLYLQHAAEQISRMRSLLIWKAFMFFLNHVKDPRFIASAKVNLMKMYYYFPGTFYNYMSYKPYSDLVNPILDNKLIPRLTNTDPQRISATRNGDIKYFNVTVHSDTTLSYEGGTVTQEYRGIYLYTLIDGTVTRINGVITTEEPSLEHPISNIAFQLKGKLEPEFIAGLAPILYYYRNKVTKAIMDSYHITMPKVMERYTKSLNVSPNIRGPFGYEEMDEQHVILCGEVYIINSDNTYTIPVERTILKSYITANNIIYDLNAMTMEFV